MSDLVPIITPTNNIIHGIQELWSHVCSGNIREVGQIKRRYSEVQISISASGAVTVSGYYVECFRCCQQIFITKRVDGHGWIL